MEGFGVIDLQRLHEEKAVFRFFSDHLIYPKEQSPFQIAPIDKTFQRTHPGYRDIARYWKLLHEKDLFSLQLLYAETFDFQKDATLYMTYVKFEDSKERGQMLARLKVLYEMFGLQMPQSELSDYLPLMCEFIYAADWEGDPRAEESFSLLLAVLEDGSYHLMHALKKYESPYYYLIRGMRETFKACLSKKEVPTHD